jgi:(E)-4-hydroxy-3-methylbut-2-enyl-diphosphate synthase
VIIQTPHSITETQAIIGAVCRTQTTQKDSPIEGLLVKIESLNELASFAELYLGLETVLASVFLELGEAVDLSDLERFEWPKGELCGITIVQKLSAEDSFYAVQLHQFCKNKGFNLALDCSAEDLENGLGAQLEANGPEHLILTGTTASDTARHPLGAYRALVESAGKFLPQVPLWIRNTVENSIAANDYFSDRLIEGSILSGALICDGLGDALSIEAEPLPEKANALAYNILQGARARMSKTEFVACPSCGRTLFDLQEVTQTIRARTNHLKGVTIAIMGCIVNGPGEMADADFGYVGGAPEKINLYVGRECVEYNVPASEALNRLIDLIKSHGKWVEPSAN